MEDIKFLLDVMVNETLTKEDIDTLQSYKDFNMPLEATEVFLNNKRYELDKKFRVEALRDVLKKKYYNYYKTLIETEDVGELLPTLKKIKEMEDKEPEIKKSNIMFITLAPAENEISVDNFVKKTIEFCEFKYVKQYVFVIEQRFNGVPNDKYKKLGEGMHIHILWDKGEHKLSDIKRDFKRKFAGYEINTDFSFRHQRDLFKTQNYMLGEKKDTDKQIKQQQDSIWREKSGLKEFWGTKFI